MMNLPDEIYDRFIREIDSLKIKADTPAVQVVGELTRALKRIVIRHGGTAIIIDGIHYDMDGSEVGID
jgi:hypothetical protein